MTTSFGTCSREQMMLSKFPDHVVNFVWFTDEKMFTSLWRRRSMLNTIIAFTRSQEHGSAMLTPMRLLLFVTEIDIYLSQASAETLFKRSENDWHQFVTNLFRITDAKFYNDSLRFYRRYYKKKHFWCIFALHQFSFLSTVFLTWATLIVFGHFLFIFILCLLIVQVWLSLPLQVTDSKNSSPKPPINHIMCWLACGGVDLS